MANIAGAVPPSDFSKPSAAPKYSNVDVVVEFEWSPEPIKSEDVNVIEITKNEKPTALLLMKGLKKESELSIVKGVTIKVYDHKTGELLKTYKA
jgi:hypothetical protein